MTKYKEHEGRTPEVYFLVPRRDQGLMSDTGLLKAVSRLNERGSGLGVVVSTTSEAFSLVYRYCAKKGIDFKHPNRNESPYDLAKSAVEQHTDKPRVAVITPNMNDDFLDETARKLRKLGIDTEVRKLY